MTPDANGTCVFAIKRGGVENKEIYCNPLFPFYISLMNRYRNSPYCKGTMVDYLEVNPKTNCGSLADDMSVSFVPMPNVQEKKNLVAYDNVPYSKVKKGFTVFQRGDLIWAKITPCMQNGKSCIVDKMPTEIGFGSTEFHVVRKRSSLIYMPFIWAIFANDNVLKAAQAVFGGSAGQQRVSASFLETFPAVIPEYAVQVKLVSNLERTLERMQDRLAAAESARKELTVAFAKRIDVSVPLTSNDLCSALTLSAIRSNPTSRIDPKCYSKKYHSIKAQLAKSQHTKYKLRDLITEITGGDWGYDLENGSASRIKCLVLRATEISNKNNIVIRPEKAQYRQIETKKFNSMNIDIGDIIIEKSGGSIDQPVGRVIYVDRLTHENAPIAYSNFLTKIKINKALVDPYYLYEYLRFVYGIGLTEVMQNQTNGIRNLIIDEFLDQTVIVPANHHEIGCVMKQLRLQIQEAEQLAEQDWKFARMQFEKELLGEQNLSSKRNSVRIMCSD